jgi:hypothetical protein
VSVVDDKHVARARSSSHAPHYAYGIVRAGASGPPRSGVLGGEVTTVAHGSIAALVTPLETERVRAKRRDLLAHSDVVQDAHAQGTVLPLRFGTVFESAEDLRTRLLEPRHDELLSLLGRFDGLGEMRIRARYHDQESVLAEVVEAAPEIARLRSRARSQADLVQLGEVAAKTYAARRDSDADAIVRRLAAASVEAHVDAPDDELSVVKASFLVRDRRAFDEQLDAVALALRHLVDFTCTGPMPPHSFVALRADGDA